MTCATEALLGREGSERVRRGHPPSRHLDRDHLGGSRTPLALLALTACPSHQLPRRNLSSRSGLLGT